MQIVFNSKTNDELRNKLSTLRARKDAKRQTASIGKKQENVNELISSSNIRIADDASFYTSGVLKSKFKGGGEEA